MGILRHALILAGVAVLGGLALLRTAKGEGTAAHAADGGKSARSRRSTKNKLKHI
jgi:hypothetical protein